MSESAAGLRHKIDSAAELHSIVRTMKTVAAANIGRYGNAVAALDEYYRTVQLGLSACFNQKPAWTPTVRRKEPNQACLIVFGSSQGLVGPFNNAMLEFVTNSIAQMPGNKVLWTVGEQINALLGQSAMQVGASFDLPNSVSGITLLLEQILVQIERHLEQGDIDQVILCYNHPLSGEMYAPASQCLLPLDEAWRRNLTATDWPTNNLPEVVNDAGQTQMAFLREYLFVSIFRACAQSQESENISRLAAMQRAEKNIDELLDALDKNYHRIRQSNIDEELFELISGFEALATSRGV